MHERHVGDWLPAVVATGISALTLGMTSPFILWLAFALVRKVWIALAALFSTALFVLLFAYIDELADETVGLGAIFLWFAGTAATCAAFVSLARVRQERRRVHPSLLANRNAEADVLRRRDFRARAREIAAQDPGKARELGIGRPDLNTGYDDGGLTDVNHAPETALAALPGMSPEHARRIAQARHEGRRFVSAEELAMVADVHPQDVENLREYTVYL